MHGRIVRTRLEKFVHILNTHHPSIKLKQKCSDLEINFLNTTFFFKNEKDCKRFRTRVYFKPTDTHALLHKLSYHLLHTFWGIVKSHILRFCRICSREADFQKATAILFRSLRKRGYSRSFFEDGTQRRSPAPSPPAGAHRGAG